MHTAHPRCRRREAHHTAIIGCYFVFVGGAAVLPPLFFPEILRNSPKNPKFSSKLQANYQQIKIQLSNLQQNKIFIFFIKKCCNYKKSGIFAMSNNNKKNNKNKAIMKNTEATRLASVLNKAEKMGFNRIDTLNLINEYYIKGQDIECMVLKMNGGKFSAKLFVEVLYA